MDSLRGVDLLGLVDSISTVPMTTDFFVVVFSYANWGYLIWCANGPAW